MFCPCEINEMRMHRGRHKEKGTLDIFKISHAYCTNYNWDKLKDNFVNYIMHSCNTFFTFFLSFQFSTHLFKCLINFNKFSIKLAAHFVTKKTLNFVSLQIDFSLKQTDGTNKCPSLFVFISNRICKQCLPESLLIFLQGNREPKVVRTERRHIQRFQEEK